MSPAQWLFLSPSRFRTMQGKKRRAVGFDSLGLAALALAIHRWVGLKPAAALGRHGSHWSRPDARDTTEAPKTRAQQPFGGSLASQHQPKHCGRKRKTLRVGSVFPSSQKPWCAPRVWSRRAQFLGERTHDSRHCMASVNSEEKSPFPQISERPPRFLQVHALRGSHSLPCRTAC